MTSVIRFQCDADFNFNIVRGLRRSQPAIDILTAEDSQIVGRTDPEVLLFSAEHDRLLVSHDLRTMPDHFMRFLTAGNQSKGVIIIRQQLPIGEAIEWLHLIWLASDTTEWLDRLEILP